LDALKSKSSIQRTTEVLNDLANELRLELGRLAVPKWNIDNCQTVNMNLVKVGVIPQRSVEHYHNNKNKNNVNISFIGISLGRHLLLLAHNCRRTKPFG
jgi:hypothetical protein